MIVGCEDGDEANKEGADVPDQDSLGYAVEKMREEDVGKSCHDANEVSNKNRMPAFNDKIRIRKVGHPEDEIASWKLV